MRCLSIPSIPAVRAPPEAKVTRAASASQVSVGNQSQESIELAFFVLR